MFDVVKNVQFLSIACNPGNQQCSFKNIPVFQNLIHIELWFRCCLCLYWDDVAELLRYCPKLQILLINKQSAPAMCNSATKIPIIVMIISVPLLILQRANMQPDYRYMDLGFVNVDIRKFVVCE
ncbi:hypothetical protein P8452_54973 [Trifolium repens]|nr:hypothetical protein P8452_54973 [Trifolium repens]